MDDYFKMLSSYTPSAAIHRPLPAIDPALQDLSVTAASTSVITHSERSSSPRSLSGDISHGSESGQDSQDFEQAFPLTQPFATPARSSAGGNLPRRHFPPTAVTPHTNSNILPDDFDIALEADDDAEGQPHVGQYVQFAEDYGRSQNFSNETIASGMAFAKVSASNIRLSDLSINPSHHVLHSVSLPVSNAQMPEEKQRIVLFYGITETKEKQLKVVDTWHPDNRTIVSPSYQFSLTPY